MYVCMYIYKKLKNLIKAYIKKWVKPRTGTSEKSR